MAPQKRTTLVYSFVARGAVVLADHAEVSGNFASVAAQCLQKLPSTNNRHSYNCDGHTFNYHVHDGFSNGTPHPPKKKKNPSPTRFSYIKNSMTFTWLNRQYVISVVLKDAILFPSPFRCSWSWICFRIWHWLDRCVVSV